MPTPSILIVGAGELGTAVLNALQNHPHHRKQQQPQGSKIAVLRRAQTLQSTNPQTKEENNRLSSQGIALEAGDFVNSPVSDLASIFARYDVVIQCGGFGLPAGTQTRVAEAALLAGVERFFPWQFGLDYPAVVGRGSSSSSSKPELFDEMLRVRELLARQKGRGTKTKWTVVSTGLFASFLFHPEFGVVDLESRVVTALGGRENRVTITAPEDIGVMVAEMVYVPEGTLDAVVFVAGDTVSYGELAGRLGRVYGAEFELREWDARELERSPDGGMVKYRAVFAAGLGTAWDKERTLNHQRGIKLLNLEEYLAKHKM